MTKLRILLLSALIAVLSMQTNKAQAVPFGTLGFYYSEIDGTAEDSNEGETSALISSGTDPAHAAYAKLFPPQFPQYDAILGAKAFGVANADAAAQNQYTYIGTEPTSLTFEVELAGTTAGGASIFGGVEFSKAPVTFFLRGEGDNFPAFYDPENFLGDAYVNINEFSSNLNSSVSFEVVPGDVFVMNFYLVSSSVGGGFANAFDTLSGGFVDSSQLIAASGVPEPSSLALSLGILALITARRPEVVRCCDPRN